MKKLIPCLIGLSLLAMTWSASAQVVNSFDSGAVAVSKTPNSSSHASGTSVGGLFTIPLARTIPGSGIITNFSVTSTGGATVGYLVRVWQTKPATTTCTDNTAFSSIAAEDLALVTPPLLVTPAAPSVTTGDTKTYAGQQGLSWDYKTTDGNVYVCLITNATDTADESAAVVVMLSGPQN